MLKTEQSKIDYIISNFNVSSTILSKELNIPASTIRKIKNDNGIKIKKRFNPNINEFIEIYDNLKSSRKVAEYYNVNKTSVLNFAKKINYKTSKELLLNAGQEKDICNSYNICTAKELSLKYGVSESTISKIWMLNNLKGKKRYIYQLNQECFNSINDKNAYLLGFIASDGCINYTNSNKQAIIRICIHKKDIEILYLFKEVYETEKPFSYYKDYVSLEISSNIIKDRLIELGLDSNKTYHNTIQNIPEQYMTSFIRGYFDGDGTITKTNQISIVGYEKNLLKIQKFLKNRNIFSSFTYDNRKNISDETGSFGILTFTNNISKYCFLKLIYKDCDKFYLSRKFKKAQEFINSIENSNEIRDKQIKIYYEYAVQGQVSQKTLND